MNIGLVAGTTLRKVVSGMKKDRILKLIGGFGVGIGVGTCLGVAINNILVGFLLGIGVGLCYAVAFGAFKKV